jgi:hypothetical protein
MAAAMEKAIAVAGDAGGIYLSLDMDALDPDVAPGVGTPVRGGLTYREAQLAMEMLAASGRLRSIEIAEVNPILDTGNRTARLALLHEHVHLGTYPKLRQIDSGLDRKAGPRNYAPLVVGLEVVHIGTRPVDLGADRVAGAVYEGIAETALPDETARHIIHLVSPQFTPRCRGFLHCLHSLSRASRTISNTLTTSDGGSLPQNPVHVMS